MKLKSIVDATPILRKIAGQELTCRTLYGIAKCFSRLETELRFYTEQRAFLLGKYCDRNENKYIPKSECKAEFEEKLSELLETEVDVGDVIPVRIPSSEPLKLSYNELEAVRDFIEIVKEE